MISFIQLQVYLSYLALMLFNLLSPLKSAGEKVNPCINKEQSIAKSLKLLIIAVLGLLINLLARNLRLGRRLYRGLYAFLRYVFLFLYAIIKRYADSYQYLPK